VTDSLADGPDDEIAKVTLRPTEFVVTAYRLPISPAHSLGENG
jgi:hypothetical protein